MPNVKALMPKELQDAGLRLVYDGHGGEAVASFVIEIDTDANKE